MSNISDFIKYDLTPALFEHIDIAFPEHNFKRYNRGWKSKTTLFGSSSDREDKTVITQGVPGRIMEQGGDNLSLIDYVMKRDKVDFLTAVKTLASVVKLNLPQSANFDPEKYAKQQEKASILEDAQGYFIYCLHNSKNAKPVNTYLSKRGYTKIEIETLGLGFIPNQEKLYTFLIDTKKHNKESVYEALLFTQQIGETHQLSIPYRSGGTLKGFIFRAIRDEKPKYLNSTGLKRSEEFFNIKATKGNKDLIIVEGILDALIADVKGVDNVVSLGGVNLSHNQVKDAKKRGTKKFTICLDSDKAGEEATLKAIEILTYEDNRVYIAQLPTTNEIKTDPDSFIRTHGVDEFQKIISKALPYFEYQLNVTLEKFSRIDHTRGLESKDIDDLLEEIVNTSKNIKSPIDRDRYTKLFTSLEAVQQYGITEESLTATINKLRYTADKEQQEKAFNKMLTEAKAMDAPVTDVLKYVEIKSKELRLIDKATEFDNLLLPVSQKSLKDRIEKKPESLQSGIEIGGEKLYFPAGALSVLAAPTSHGKTTFLINLALNIAQEYPDREFHFVSFEEDSDTIVLNALNTHINEHISSNNRKSILSYYATGSVEYMRENWRNGEFTFRANQFFSLYIEKRRLNFHYSYYDSDTLIEAIRYLHKNTNMGGVFIDYIQLLNLPQGKYKTYSRQEEIKEICIALKNLSVETGLPIILGAQFNREVTNLLKIHPTRIGEAGDIERIANLIVGFWNNNFKPIASESELNEIALKGVQPDTIYATILKQRGGKVGLEEILEFTGNTGKIKNRSIKYAN